MRYVLKSAFQSCPRAPAEGGQRKLANPQKISTLHGTGGLPVSVFDPGSEEGIEVLNVYVLINCVRAYGMQAPFEVRCASRGIKITLKFDRAGASDPLITSGGSHKHLREPVAITITDANGEKRFFEKSPGQPPVKK